MTKKVTRIKIAIVASLLTLAILLCLQLAGFIDMSLHIFPAAFSLVAMIFVVSYFLPLEK